MRTFLTTIILIGLFPLQTFAGHLLSSVEEITDDKLTVSRSISSNESILNVKETASVIQNSTDGNLNSKSTSGTTIRYHVAMSNESNNPENIDSHKFSYTFNTALISKELNNNVDAVKTNAKTFNTQRAPSVITTTLSFNVTLK